MRWKKWMGIAVAIALIFTCFFPWVVVPDRQIVISGIKAEGTNYGKPGYLSILLSVIFLFFAFIPRILATRVNIFIATLCFSWSLRNFILLSRCEAGECPQLQPAFYLFFALSFLLLVCSLIATDVTVKNDGE
jgi:hypothetical protein